MIKSTSSGPGGRDAKSRTKRGLYTREVDHPPDRRPRVGAGGGGDRCENHPDQTTLITRLASEDLQRIQTAVVTSLDAGVNINDLEATLRGISGFSPRRAQLVAMDQTNKLNITVQRANDLSLGFTRAVWIHVPGEFTSRETHREFNGQEFDLQEGMYDIDVGHNVQCAELPALPIACLES